VTLRGKLLFLALAMFIVPWVGWRFVLELEDTLRQAQAQSLLGVGEALARSLEALEGDEIFEGPAWYLHTLPRPPRLDGFADDWATAMSHAQPLPRDDPEARVRVAAAAAGDAVFLLVDVTDATPVRASLASGGAAGADHLRLRLDTRDGRGDFLIASAGPGRAEIAPAPGSNLIWPLAGEWQETPQGYRVELLIPRRNALRGLGLAVADVARPRAVASWVGSGQPPQPPQATWPILGPALPSLSAALRQLTPDNVRGRLLSDEGWVLASVETQLQPAEPFRPKTVADRLVYPLLRQLREPFPRDDDLDPRLPRIDTEEIWQARSGIAASGWRQAGDDERARLLVAVPLNGGGSVRGVLLLEQVQDTHLLFTQRALVFLLAATLLAIFLTAIVMLVFAGVLSYRIRRLRNAAERALRGKGSLEPFRHSSSRDELGDLSRSFARLMDEIAAYTQYLNTLASKLSHELNTPLAIVRSSLDNLENESLPDQARTYAARARGGAERLGSILRAMSEASRIERAVEQAEPEDFDLRALVQGCAEGYRTLAGDRRIDTVMPVSPVPMHGAPELIAQALDKLLDNALSFTPDDGWIRISLERRENGALLSMANQGPMLPAGYETRLFDSLVSVRERRGGGSHLGLGLYIVRLVAEAHRGKVWAENLPGGSGVVFSLQLGNLPRKRISSADDALPAP
jgi:two-component system, OmpR family, sensor histidine kinase ChvG